MNKLLLLDKAIAAYIKAAYAADVAEATYDNAVYNKTEAEDEARDRLVEATTATIAAAAALAVYDKAKAEYHESKKEI